MTDMYEKKNPFLGGFRVTSPYGERTFNGKSEHHSGLDIVGIGTREVRAVVGGRVLASRMITDKSNATWQWGLYVCIEGDDGICCYYCHLDSALVSENDRVRAGQVIGIMGNTGYSFGAHTHLEIRKSDRRTVLHPAEYLGIENKAGEYDIEIGSPSPWAADAIGWAADAGIMLGSVHSGGSIDYMPKKVCTREETAVFLHRFYKYLKGELYDRGNN